MGTPSSPTGLEEGPMTAPATGLKLEGVSFDYRAGTPEAVPVLDDVTLEAVSGRLTVVAGRSGSGKTTLLRIAAGLLLPDSGAVVWNGSPLHGFDEDARAKWRRTHVGMAIQGGGLIDTLTAAENVALPSFGKRSADHRVRVDALLEQVGLTHRAGHFPAQLSTGEQQRVAIARALYADPSVLLVDEPTANLDRGNADAIADLLSSLASDLAVAAATHDHSLIERADALLILD
jgi:ABC-type lipoprotein export system ATPase subunit